MYVRKSNSQYRPRSSRTSSRFRKKMPFRRRPNSTRRIAAYNKSSARFYKSRALSRRQNLTTETKLLPFKVINELGPDPIQIGALASHISFTLGGVPASWGYFTDLQGMDPAVGTASNERIGSYVFLKKCHFMYEIDMKAIPTAASVPTEFRFIIAKSRRLAVPAGQNRDPASSLFLSLDGGDFGHATAGINGTDLMWQPLNRRIYTIYKDHKFMLSNPADPLSTVNVATSSYYPCMKRFSLDLPFYTKANFTASTKPTDVDYHWIIVLYARSLNKDVAANNFEVNVRGNLQYTDP